MKMRFAILCGLVFCMAIAVSAQKITLASGEWEPFTGEKMDGQGVITELVLAAAKAGGLEVKLVWVPWTRAEKMVKDGEAFAAFPYLVTADRKKIYDYSDPIYVAKSKIFYFDNPAKLMPWTTLKDFVGKSFGAIRGYWYIDDLKKTGIKFSETDSTKSAVAMLQAGRFDYLIESELVALAAIRAQFPGDITKFKTLDKAYGQDDLCLLVSRAWPGSADLTKKFNAGLAAIMKDGSFKTILAKYGLAAK